MRLLVVRLTSKLAQLLGEQPVHGAQSYRELPTLYPDGHGCTFGPMNVGGGAGIIAHNAR